MDELTTNDLEARIRRSIESSFPRQRGLAPSWEQIVAEARPQNTVVQRAKRQPRVRRRPALFLAGAAIVAAAVAALPATLLPGERLGATDAAAQVLDRTARVAAAAAPIPTGRYLYRRVRVVEAGIALVVPEPHTILVTRVRETWVAGDGSGRTRERTVDVSFPSERDRQRWQAAGAPLPEVGRVDDERFGTRPYLGTELSYPTDPGPLAEAIQTEASKHDQPLAQAMVVTIADLLTSPAATPELRASLYEVLSEIDGVRFDGPTTDAAGRKGVAISAPGGYGTDADNLREVLVFDPTTSTVLERRTVLVQPVEWTGGTPPLVIGSMTYLESGWIESSNRTPAGPY